MFGDTNVLVEGVRQAQVLTKTLEINAFPNSIADSVANTALSSIVERHIHKLIMSSHVLDAEQVKLPKIKLQDRPAFNLPREYGISHSRRKY